jgi:hypothetical protein
MDQLEPAPEQDTPTPQARRPRTLSVLALLAATSLVFSYLGAYAVTDTLRAADIIKPWSVGHDPRPRWLLMSFCSLMGGFILLAGVLRFLGWRQLRRLDALADATEEWRINDT